MLFIERRASARRVEPALRTPVLEKLQERGFDPLIRSMRLNCFEQALGAAEQADDFERVMSTWAGESGDVSYVRGDIFFTSDDNVLFLIFADAEDTESGVRAGIVYDPDEGEPARRLTEFCRGVDEAIQFAARGGNGAGATESGVGDKSFEWRAGEEHVPASFARFASGQETAGAATQTVARGAETAERLRANEILEDAEARRLLRRLSEAQAEGRTSEMLAGAGASEPLPEQLAAQLANAGLVRRELLISCRKDGRSLFRLPSADALAMMTASNAVCSECGAAVVDERAEELVTPTPLASTMLKDGAWLVSRLRAVLSKLGVPEAGVAARAASGEADAQMMANVCGEPFLFVLRDGEFTPAHARRALDVEADAEATHLVVVATGKIHEDARTRLREHARRRARAGDEVEMILIEGVERAEGELRAALDRVSQKALADELYELDASLGMNVGQLVAARFRLARKPVPLQDLASSAAGALAGGLSEI